MKKKFVIDFDGHQDYTIFNITSSQPDFRIAYLLNKHLGLQLQRDENMLVKRAATAIHSNSHSFLTPAICGQHII